MTTEGRHFTFAPFASSPTTWTSYGKTPKGRTTGISSQNPNYRNGETKSSGKWPPFRKSSLKQARGKLWLDYRVHRYGTLQKLRPGKTYDLTATPARAWVGDYLGKHEVLYIFFVPKIGGFTSHDRCPMGVATYWGKSKRFRYRYITVYSDLNRMEKSEGWVRWDLGIPHELWHFMRDVIPRYCGYRGWLPNDHNLEHRKMLKAECRQQGLPVEYAHEDQYSTFITWKSVAALRKAYGMTFEYAHEDQYSTFITWKSVAALRKAYGMTYEW